jgi:hypothetical protein
MSYSICFKHVVGVLFFVTAFTARAIPLHIDIKPGWYGKKNVYQPIDIQTKTGNMPHIDSLEMGSRKNTLYGCIVVKKGSSEQPDIATVSFIVEPQEQLEQKIASLSTQLFEEQRCDGKHVELQVIMRNSASAVQKDIAQIIHKKHNASLIAKIAFWSFVSLFTVVGTMAIITVAAVWIAIVSSAQLIPLFFIPLGIAATTRVLG